MSNKKQWSSKRRRREGMYRPVSNQHHLVHLDELLGEEFNHLQIHFPTNFSNGIQKYRILLLREINSGEQVRDDSLEEGNIVREELRQVDVHDGTQHLKLKRIFHLLWFGDYFERHLFSISRQFRYYFELSNIAALTKTFSSSSRCDSFRLPAAYKTAFTARMP